MMVALCSSDGQADLDNARVRGSCDGALAGTPATTGSPTPASIFVGRQRELAMLRTTLADAVAGKGGLALLVGEPGIGKTRTAEELAGEARLQGAQIFWGRCYEGEGAPAYWPWIQVIRAYTRARDPKTLLAEMGLGAVDIMQMVPEVRQRLPGLPAPAALEPPRARFRLFEAVTTCLCNAALRRPLAIILDDLHWADRPSLLLLEFLAREMRQARLLVVGTYRNLDLDWQHPLTRTLAELAREPVCRYVHLDGLSSEDVRALVEARCQAGVPHASVQAIFRQTEGNPFFVEELLRHLMEIGAISYRDGRWQSDLDAIAGEIPEGVRHVIRRRLARLSAGGVRLLTLAAAMPGGFGWEHLSAVSDESEETLLGLLDEALAARIIRERGNSGSGSGTYEFTHALIRQTLYGDLSTPRRRRLHRQIGEAIERTYRQNPEPYLADLAYHLFRAASGDAPDKAAEYARRAGDRALAAFAYEEAARLYQLALRALELRPPVDEGRRCEVLLALGEAQMKAGDPARARDMFQRAAVVARTSGSPERLARAALGFGGAWIVWAERGEVDKVFVGLLEETLTALDDEDSVLQATVLTRLAVELCHADAAGRSAVLTQRAVEMARRVGDRTVLGFALHASHFALWGSENHAECLATAEEILHVAEETADRDLALQGHRWLFSDLLERGDIPAVDAAIAAHGRLAEELRQPLYLWITRVLQSIRALFVGEFDESERLAQQYLSIGQRMHSPDVLAIFTAQMFALRREQGRLGELEAEIARFAERRPAIPAWRAMLALLCCELDREEEARAEFERMAANDFADISRNLSWPVAIAVLSEVCAVLADSRRAAALYDLLLPHAGRNIVAGRGGFPCYGSASRYLGLLAATMRNWEAAAAHFEAAVQLNSRMGARPFVARTQYDYAAMLLARGDPGDREQAKELLAEAIETAQALGMARLARQALDSRDRVRGSLVEAARPNGRTDAAYPGGLTPREVDVLRLLASGRTSKEIAEELGVSVRTAEHHTAHIYGKIGARGRVDATAYALRHGLIPVQP